MLMKLTKQSIKDVTERSVWHKCDNIKARLLHFDQFWMNFRDEDLGTKIFKDDRKHATDSLSWNDFFLPHNYLVQNSPLIPEAIF